MSPFNQPPPESIAAGVMTWHELHLRSAAHVPECDECRADALAEPVNQTLPAPSDLDRANARRIVAEQRLETLRDALRETVAGWRRAAESGGIGGACLADCVDAIESLLAAHAGDDRGESDGAEVGR